MNEDIKQVIEIILAKVDIYECWGTGECGECLLHERISIQTYPLKKDNDISSICDALGPIADKLQDLRHEGKI